MEIGIYSLLGSFLSLLLWKEGKNGHKNRVCLRKSDWNEEAEAQKREAATAKAAKQQTAIKIRLCKVIFEPV